MAPDAVGANACDTLCPQSYFPFDSFGVCIPPE